MRDHGNIQTSSGRNTQSRIDDGWYLKKTYDCDVRMLRVDESILCNLRRKYSLEEYYK